MLATFPHRYTKGPLGVKASETGQRESLSPAEGGVSKSPSHLRTLAHKVRDLFLTDPALTREVAGDRIARLPLSNDRDGLEAFVNKEVIFILFDGPKGKQTLTDLFEGRRQLPLGYLVQDSLKY